MLKSLTKWAACCLAILPCPALAADTTAPADTGADPSVGSDPWGFLDDLVGKRFRIENIDNDKLFEKTVEFSWEQPGKVIREQIIGKTVYHLYELSPDRRTIMGRRFNYSFAEDMKPFKIEVSDDSLSWSMRFDDLKRTSFTTWKITSSGWPGVYYSTKSDRDAKAGLPRLTQRYVEIGAQEGMAWSSGDHQLRDPAKWGVVASLGNKTVMFKDNPLHLRVSDDGGFIEFIRLEPDYSWLFGLLRAEGDGRFRFFQRGFNARDDLHEGRLEGDTLVLPSLVEPGYEVSIRVYDNANVGLAIDAQAYGSPEQFWSMKGGLQRGAVITPAELANPLKASTEQRAEFDSFFTPAFISQTIAYHREQRASLDRIEAEAAEQEAELAAIQAEMEAQRRSRPNFLEAVAGAYAEASADNDQMRRTLDQATRRGIAEGNAIRRQREQVGSGSGSSANGQPGLMIEDSVEPAASPQAPAEPETRQTYAWCMALRPNQNVTYSTVQQITIPYRGWSDSSMAQDFGAVAGGGVSVCSNTDSRAAAQAQLDGSKAGHRGIKQTTTSAILRP